MCEFKHKSHACPYPSIYNTLARPLAVDDSGYCLFHSRQLDWKVDKDFAEELTVLLSHYEELARGDQHLEFNFRGIVFPAGKYVNLWQNRHYTGPINFSGCTFHCPIRITDCIFQTLDFSQAVFHYPLVGKRTAFKQLVYVHAATFMRGLFLEGCHFGNSIFLDQCTFRNDGDDPRNEVQIRQTHFGRPLDCSGTHFHVPVAFYSITLDGADFSDAAFHREFFIDESTISKTVLFQRTEFLYTENFGGYLSAVDIKNVHLLEAGKIVFRGRKAFYDQVKGEMFLSLKPESGGTILIEDFNLNKLENSSKLQLLELEKKGQVVIGKGCRKYQHQTPPKRIHLQKNNQNLATELASTFVEFFKNKHSINLGVEIVSRSDDYIDLTYFTDEKISEEEFLERLARTEEEMWTLVKVKPRSVEVTPTQQSLPDKFIGAADTLINLAALMLKISARIPLGRIARKDLEQLLQSTSFSAAPSISVGTFETLQINQTILLGIGNSQQVGK